MLGSPAPATKEKAWLDGPKIRALAAARGRTAASIAAEVGVSASTLYQLGTGTRPTRPALAAAIALALGAATADVTRTERRRTAGEVELDGERVRELIAGRGATLALAAREVGVAATHLSQVLLGNLPASARLAASLAEILGVAVEEVLSNGEPRPPSAPRRGRPPEPPLWPSVDGLLSALADANARGVAATADGLLGGRAAWARIARGGEAVPRNRLARAAEVLGTTVEAISTRERPAGRPGLEVSPEAFAAALARAGKTLAEAAREARTSASALSRAATGRSTLPAAAFRRVAEALGVEDWGVLLR